MDKLEYPLRVVFWGGPDEDESPHDGYEVQGPFRRPGDLWRWANAECYLNAYPAWRDDINAIIQKQRRHGWDAIKMALDDWAMRDLEEYESPCADRARVLQGDSAWRAWQSEWREQDEVESTLPDSWRAIGPVSSCGCEDWPCCVHADDYASVPS